MGNINRFIGAWNTEEIINRDCWLVIIIGDPETVANL